MALPELVGAAEAADILEISSTNLAHHRRKLKEAGDDSFPEPAFELRMGPIWEKRAIERYRKTFESSRRRRRSARQLAAAAAVAETKSTNGDSKVTKASAATDKANGKATNGKVAKKAAAPATEVKSKKLKLASA